jgi:hypothetical protein
MKDFVAMQTHFKENKGMSYIIMIRVYGKVVFYSQVSEWLIPQVQLNIYLLSA